MSSSFPERLRARGPGVPQRWLLVAAAAGLSAAAHGAEIYWQPDIELRAEGHTNRDLVPDSDSSEEMMGYFADIGLTWGRRTPLGETRIRPRLRIQDYPKRDELRRTEQFLDVLTTHATERTSFALRGDFSRRDAYTAELLQPGFDSFDPTRPEPTSDTGRLFISNRRTTLGVAPSVTHRFTERDGLVAELRAQWVDYETEVPGTQENYNYERLDLGWRRQISPRNDFSLGPYGTHYDSDRGDELNAYGVRFQFHSAVSERTRATFTVRVQQEDLRRTDTQQSLIKDDTETSWEALLGLDRQLLVGTLRLSIGRAIVPTGAGSLADEDQVNLQLDRALSPRWSADVAVRGIRRRAHNVLSSSDDRDAASARFGLGWAATPTVSLNAGYQFMYRKFTDDPDHGIDHAVYISLSYRGLGPQSAQRQDRMEFQRQ